MAEQSMRLITGALCGTLGDGPAGLSRENSQTAAEEAGAADFDSVNWRKRVRKKQDGVVRF